MLTTPPHELFEWPALPVPCDAAGLNACLARAADLGASAVHLASGHPLKAVWDGRLYDASDRPLSDAEARALLVAVMDARLRTAWPRAGEGEGVYEADVQGVRRRFAVDVTRIVRGGGEGEGVYLVFQPVAGAPPEWSELGLPEALAAALLAARDGLVLVAAPAGGPAPDLLAACVQRWLDDPERRWNVVEIAESPGAVPDYRDGAGSNLYVRPVVEPGGQADAVRRCLRRRPHMVVVRESPSAAAFGWMLDAARVGCGVCGALVARDAAAAVRRALDLFPEGRQRAALGDLAETVRLVVAGRSVLDRDGRRLPVWEWLEVDEGVRATLRDVPPERAGHAVGAWVTGGHSFRRAADELLRRGTIAASAHADFLKAG